MRTRRALVLLVLALALLSPIARAANAEQSGDSIEPNPPATTEHVTANEALASEEGSTSDEATASNGEVLESPSVDEPAGAPDTTEVGADPTADDAPEPSEPIADPEAPATDPIEEQNAPPTAEQPNSATTDVEPANVRVDITSMSCDQTATIQWSNFAIGEVLIFVWKWSDGGPRAESSITLQTASGTQDISMFSVTADFISPAASASNPTLVLEIFRNSRESGQLMNYRSLYTCPGWDEDDPTFQLTNVDCDGTATLSWNGLTNEMAYSVYPSIMPLHEGTDLTGVQGVAGPGNGVVDLVIDLPALDGIRYSFSLTVTAGLIDDSQEVVTTGTARNCGSPPVDPGDPESPSKPVPAPEPVVDPAPLATGDGAPATAAVSSLPNTGSGSTRPAMPAGHLLLTLTAAGFALTASRHWPQTARR